MHSARSSATSSRMMQVPAHYRMTRPARYLSWTISAGIILTFHYFFMSDSPIRYISSNVTEPFNNDALKTPRKYEAKNLYKWTRALPVPHISGRPGELGKAVVLNAEEDEEAKRRFKEHEFNIVASDTISVNRSLADVRHPHCLSVEYLPRLPKTSVVIIFHNEAWSTLTRSIWSAINRSPKELLKEIILVDDKSTFDYLGNQLDEYVRTLRVPVKVLRMDERFGIVKARLLGAANAEQLFFHSGRSDYVFGFTHRMYSKEGWLEPLLSRIAENRRIVAIPVIDNIEDRTFEYQAGNSKLLGGFDWQFFFRWIPMSKQEKDRVGNSTVSPLYTPIMPGGLFSIDKDFFHDIGSYDDGMMIWGSENIEMSLRVWMCGGVLELVPCSRVAHVYRKNSPYSYPNDNKSFIQMLNKRRVVDVWLEDEWKSFYYSLNPDRNTSAQSDISSRIALKNNLKCKNFQWYVDNIYPEINVRKNAKFIGQIQSVDAQTCLAANGDKSDAILYPCTKTASNQIFMLTKENEVRSFSLCLDAPTKNENVKTFRCHHLGGNQKWDYDEVKMTFHHNSGPCLESSVDNGKLLHLKACDGNKRQQWILTSINVD